MIGSAEPGGRFRLGGVGADFLRNGGGGSLLVMVGVMDW